LHLNSTQPIESQYPTEIKILTLISTAPSHVPRASKGPVLGGAATYIETATKSDINLFI
jgi:hypothetical protein